MTEPAPLPVITSPLLEAAGVRHAFFTRQGGVSAGLYGSLNVGPGSEDSPEDVAENRRRTAAHFGLPPEALNTCHQVHSAEARIAERPWGAARPEADAVVTRTPGLICGALAADCAPVLLADPDAGVVGAAHAGWKGALGGVVADAVAKMTELGARPGRIVAAVGPCIAQASYEVGAEFLDRFAAADAGHERFFRSGESAGKHMFDLPGFVLSRLAAAGVANAEWVGRDTCAEADLFFSNRRAFKRGEADYGRLLSAIVL
ncbi:peptidoglycan editing factor PgeF [Phenylobacterium sp.]|uniref:peptidoglycan editing factor PgeF n=1 Tax=Phenylobacterium sp. TaxID=1871053 RepID=UPI0008AB3BDA|nr:peptidoglycan editing factor PgeF [Phenylobacterium sp.]MBA4793481.1 peptidoglycan editing factor PgeF [Phenylobacterium sp.]MBC7167029.1 peptidoglycan editing factor PgeF [Phenylobacterium sp.]OHB35076.1 MAG: polyphenol oxidase [Phenylobacterium sp. RIFCSPHIGHO2_01_FULL_70_10]